MDTGWINDRFRERVNTDAWVFADDLAMLLNRATRQHLRVSPDIDDDGVTYGIEWAFDGEHRSLTVEHHPQFGWRAADE